MTACPYALGSKLALVPDAESQTGRTVRQCGDPGIPRNLRMHRRGFRAFLSGAVRSVILACFTYHAAQDRTLGTRFAQTLIGDVVEVE